MITSYKKKSNVHFILPSNQPFLRSMYYSPECIHLRNESEEELLKQCPTSNAAAFELLFVRYGKEVLAIADGLSRRMSFLCDKEEFREALASEIYMTILEGGLKKCEGKCLQANYLLTMVRNMAANLSYKLSNVARRQSEDGVVLIRRVICGYFDDNRCNENFSNSYKASDEFANYENKEVCRLLIESLSNATQRQIVLWRMEDYSSSEIVKMLPEFWREQGEIHDVKLTEEYVNAMYQKAKKQMSKIWRRDVA